MPIPPIEDESLVALNVNNLRSMAYHTKSYKKSDGWGYKADRKYEADRAERYRIKRKLYANKNIHNSRVQNMFANKELF